MVASQDLIIYVKYTGVGVYQSASLLDVPSVPGETLPSASLSDDGRRRALQLGVLLLQLAQLLTFDGIIPPYRFRQL